MHQHVTHSWKIVSFITNVHKFLNEIMASIQNRRWVFYRENKVKQMFREEKPAICLQIISDDINNHESSGHINLKRRTSAETHEQHVSSNQTVFANE